MTKVENNKEINTSKVPKMPEPKKKSHWFLRLLLFFFYFSLVAIIAFFVILNLPSTKNRIAQEALVFLNKDLKLNLSAENVEINFFGDVAINDLKIKDHRNLDFIKAQRLEANSDWLSLIKSTSNLKFNKIILRQPVIDIYTYKGENQDNFAIWVKKFDNGKKSTTVFEMYSWIDIYDGTFNITNQNMPLEDGKWLRAKKLNLSLRDLKVKGPDVTAFIKRFDFETERFGKIHKVEDFSADFQYKTNGIFIDNLVFKTDYSMLLGSIALKHTVENGFDDFNNQVKFDMKFNKNSYISGYDIAYFAKDFDNPEPLFLSAHATGPLNELLLNDIDISAKNVKLSAKSLKLHQVITPAATRIEAQNLKTDFTYISLKKVLPSFISKKMGNYADNYGQLNYNGAIVYTPVKISVDGRLKSGLGNAIAKLELGDFSTKTPFYKGFAQLSNFNLKKLTQNKQLGLVSGSFRLDGKGFDPKTLQLKTQSNIASFDFNGENYKNIQINGVLSKMTYKGTAAINESRGKAFVDGFIDFSTKKLKANVVADIDYLQLDRLGYPEKNSILKGKFNTQLSMTNLNDLDVKTNIGDLRFKNALMDYHVPKSALKVSFTNGERDIDVEIPNTIEASVVGKYQLEDLGTMFQNAITGLNIGVNKMKVVRNQNFRFNATVYQNAIKMFSKELILPDNIVINGNYTSNNNHFTLFANLPQALYLLQSKIEPTDEEKTLAQENPTYSLKTAFKTDSLKLQNLVLNIDSQLPDKQISATIASATYKNNLVNNVQLNVTKDAITDELKYQTNFKYGASLDDLKDYTFNFRQGLTPEKDFIFRFDPTKVLFNDFNLEIDTSVENNHSIVYLRKKKEVMVNNLRLFSDESELFLNARFKDAKDFSADARVVNLDISKLIPEASRKSLDIKGIADGDIKIVRNKSKLEPIVDFKIKNLAFNGTDLGDLVFNATDSSTKENVYDVDIHLSKGLISDNTIQIKGEIDNNTSTPNVNLNARLDQFDLGFADQFVNSVFSNFRGKTTGDIKITGKMNEPNYNGALMVQKFGFKLKFSGVDYQFEDAIIPISKGLVQFNELRMRDGRKNSKGTLSGIMSFESVDKLAVNLILRATDLMLLNTTQKDFDVFWGNIYSKGDLYIDGLVTALNIDADAEILGGSNFTLNSNANTTAEEFKMLRFVQIDKHGNSIVGKKKANGANINVNLKLDVNKNSIVKVLVGDDIGDISVRGNAKDMQFRLTRSGQMNLSGSFFIDSGSYVSKMIVNKEFLIEKGSEISWDRDVMNPSLNITANYNKMVSNIGEYLSIGRIQPTVVQLQTKITNNMSNPDIKFDIKLPDVSSQVKDALAFKMNTESEKILQFGSILALNSFNTSSIGGSLATSAYGLGLKQLSSVLNNFSNNVQFDLDYIEGNRSSKISDRANANLNYNVNSRLKLKTGLGIPIASSNSEATNQNFLTGEGIIEYDPTKKNDGSFVLRAYSKPSNIGLTMGSNAGSNQSYGLGVLFSRRFNHLFSKKKLAKPKDSVK